MKQAVRLIRLMGVAVFTILLSSCGVLLPDIFHPEDPTLAGREKPEEGVVSSDIRAAIHRDVRLRELDQPEQKGRPDCPEVFCEDEGWVCRKHEDQYLGELEFPYAYEEGPRAVRETALYCGTEGVYWYRWRKLEPAEERWHGPFPLAVLRKK